jgi:hypothetical protein
VPVVFAGTVMISVDDPDPVIDEGLKLALEPAG